LLVVPVSTDPEELWVVIVEVYEPAVEVLVTLEICRVTAVPAVTEAGAVTV
jgi:hypothetical protein